MKRRKFLAGTLGTLGLAALPATAFASGGLDLDGPGASPDLRILLSRESVRRYRGRLASINLPDGRNGVLNTLSLEEYLYGVVPMEMPSSWPYAALEAQAILARTFAVRKRNAQRPYDLVAGTADQEYGGITAEALSATAAVDACSGLIVTYDGRPASIAYMSACGGHTDDAARVWGGSVPYMAGVPCTFCADAPSARWSVDLDWPAIARAAGLDAGMPPTAAQLVDLGPGGRPGAVVFSTARGDGRIDIAKLREASGYRLPSTFVHSISIDGMNAQAPQRRAFPAQIESTAAAGPQVDPGAIPAGTVPAPPLPRELADDSGASDDAAQSVKITCIGSGSGHGVGVCQWGARGMAAAGYTAQAIVAYYLPNTRLGSANDGAPHDDPPAPARSSRSEMLADPGAANDQSRSASQPGVSHLPELSASDRKGVRAGRDPFDDI